MNRIDMRFNNTIINNWIGKVFKKYRCDQFEYTNSVTRYVGLFIGDDVYTLQNVQNYTDYFGNKDNVAIYSLVNSNEKDIKSAFVDRCQTDTPISGLIDSIKLINECQRVSVNGTVTHEVLLTRAIIFEVDGREISFEKDNVPFSEEIIIRRGYNLSDKLTDMSDFLDEWDDGIKPECYRETIMFN